MIRKKPVRALDPAMAADFAPSQNPLRRATEAPKKSCSMKMPERKSLRSEAVSRRILDHIMLVTTKWRLTPGFRRSQPPIRQTSKGSKPPSEFLGRLRHREHHRTLRRGVGEFGKRAKIKRPEAVYQAGADGQLDRPEHMATV
jgi:hypothetical protein